MENKYDSTQPTAVSSIDPTYGVIDQTFILNGNFPGAISDIKVYFGKKRAVLTATNGQCITGLVPKEPNGYNQISVVIGKDSIAPNGLLFRYHQSKSMKTICGKLGPDNKWMNDADYAGTPIDAVSLGETHYVQTVAGVKSDNVFLIEAGWGNKLFLLSIDDGTITKLSTPAALCHPAVPTSRDKFYATTFWNGNRTIYAFKKENSWTFNTTGITITSADYPGDKVCSMTFAEDDNLLYCVDSQGRIAEINLSDKSYKIYTTADQKPSGLAAANFGGLIIPAAATAKTPLAKQSPKSFDTWEGSYITYSKYHHCFFLSFAAEHAIYKYVKNSDNTWTCSLYAGGNGPGVSVGDRLVDAQFNSPHGLVVNADGEIFVVSKGSNFWTKGGDARIQKISGDAVEIAAGNSNGTLTNGTTPIEATFQYPRDIAIDVDGNYFIAGGQEGTVRKLSIE
ncbi:NHL repeat containing protein [Paludibacter propionicigenes WB4]|uniref:NHL repeat containing protein n=1 Tax=Paludibacter propionicigenes (strain DSM 17365 / JCM 13257 / WB4) TaxID=694427 RepID=E4T5L0_PALPW|nr:IPT/TIG domain-containing protein [Paludibacter propionicigenes]ADQ80004.1 NHL repeat containing protein [Paludibacter propionicigenes WB4]